MFFSRKAIHIDFLGFHVFHKFHFGVEDAKMVEGKSALCQAHFVTLDLVGFIVSTSTPFNP